MNTTAITVVKFLWQLVIPVNKSLRRDRIYRISMSFSRYLLPTKKTSRHYLYQVMERRGSLWHEKNKCENSPKIEDRFENCGAFSIVTALLVSRRVEFLHCMCSSNLGHSQSKKAVRNGIKLWTTAHKWQVMLPSPYPVMIIEEGFG